MQQRCQNSYQYKTALHGSQRNFSNDAKSFEGVIDDFMLRGNCLGQWLTFGSIARQIFDSILTILDDIVVNNGLHELATLCLLH